MICLVSGGFDPLHIGHLRMMREAASKYGRLVVALNSDAWLMRKKGYVFMPFDERKEILGAITWVNMVLAVKDDDGTICDLLDRFRPNFFCNGGDRTTANPAEHEVCEKYGIKEVFGVGGGKIQSSSALVKAAI
jgi:D-beta-D-heptose 7-phosphate kinase/D-beta-D-heptose 1-phosphate adenosyltransferase